MKPFEIVIESFTQLIQERDRTIQDLRKELDTYKRRPGLLNATSKDRLSNAMQQYNDRPISQQVEI